MSSAQTYFSRYVEIRRDHKDHKDDPMIETSTSWEERMLAGLSALRKKKKPESESERRMLVESESATASTWEKRMLAESESETSTTWEQRMLDREAGGRMQSGKRRRKDQDEQQKYDIHFNIRIRVSI